MVAIKKSRKISNRLLVKKLIAGAFSPVSASRKIQSISRGRTTRQSIKKDTLLTLFSKGATTYKKALQTLDFRGISMKGQVLSRRVLDGGKFQNVDFTDCRINGAKLNNVNADGAIFKNTELKKTQATKSSFKKSFFVNPNLEGFNSKDSIFSGARFERTTGNLQPIFKNSIFEECNFENAIFSKIIIASTSPTFKTFFKNCNLNGVKFIDITTARAELEISRCNIDNITFKNSSVIFPSIRFPVNDKGEKIVDNLRIEETNKVKLTQPILIEGITLNNLYIDNVLFHDNTKFIDCNFVNLKLNREGEQKFVQFFKASFMGCTFGNCDFGKFLGHSSRYINCVFQNSNLSECDLRACSFNRSSFINCNMDKVKFIRSDLNGVTFTEETILTNIDFQECEGMEGMNFQGLNLQGAKMIGISDPGLNACNFRDANLRGVQFDFSQIHGSDFTGADLTGSNVRVAEGSDQTVGIPADQEEGRAVDTHKTFYNIRINMLVDFYKEKIPLFVAKYAGSDNDLRALALTALKLYIQQMDANDSEKQALTSGLDTCFTERLNSYNFGQIIAGTDPQVDFRSLIYYVIKYLQVQPKEFQDIYVQSLILDSTQAYGPRGMSCAAGIVERFVTVMEQAAVVVKDTKPEKEEEYVELINIITNDPKSLIKNYQQEWFEYHSESGPNAFAESASLDTIMDNYKAFLEERFDYANLRGANQEKIKRVIMNDPNAGVNITREYIENSILFFGGRVKDNRHLNYFKMLKERFYIRDRYKKTRNITKKHKDRKHKGRKNKKTRTRVKKHAKFGKHKK